MLVANDIAPADMLQFKRSVFTGFVTDVGGKTSHTAIVARSMDIPAVVGAREASRLIRQDDWVVIDGDAGIVIVDPSPIVLEEYRFRQRQRELKRERPARLRHTPAVTLDGERVELLANIELPATRLPRSRSAPSGVGLFRSEFLFMNRDGELPGEDEQFEAYRLAVEAMKGLPVTIRTVDIGADKPLERMSANELRHEHALNPALGLRAIRWSLSEPGMFRQQLRAILRASAYGKVSILIPMVAHMSEVRHTLEALARAKQQLREAGRAFADVELGAMIEVPAAALDAAGVPASLRFRLDRHQRPDPVHARDRSCRRSGRASLQPVAPGRPAAAGAVRSPKRARPARLSASAVRWPAIRPSPRSCSGWACAVSRCIRRRSQRSSSAVLRTDTRRWSEWVERVLESDDPEKECLLAQAACATPRASAASQRAASRAEARGAGGVAAGSFLR